MNGKARRGLLRIGALAAALVVPAPDRAGAAPGAWVEAQELIPADGAAGDGFGASVAVAGDVAMVGAHQDDHSGLVNAGAVYVFARQPDGTWQESQRLTAVDAAAGDGFGAHLDFDGVILLVAAPGNDHSGLANPGSAYVFEKIGSSWLQVQKLTASDAASGDGFGTLGCSVEGDVLVVAAMRDDHSGKTDAGSAYVFVRDEGVWRQHQKVVAGDPQYRGRFGKAALISGSTILVSATTRETEFGSVYVFQLQGGGWVQTQKVFAYDRSRYDEFGAHIAMDGATLVAGAPEDEHSGLTNPGSAYILEMVAGLLQHRQKIIAGDPWSQAVFGAWVTIEGDLLAVGAGSLWQPALPGAVYVFARQGSTWVEQAKLVPGDGGPGDRFGRRPVLSQDTLLVGAWRHDHAGLVDSGAVYVFTRPDQPPVALCRDLEVITGHDACEAGASINDGSYHPDGADITLTQEPPGPYGLGVTDVLLTVSDGALADTCQAAVTVRDEAAPFVQCNAPPSFSPWEVPVSFTATGTDNCGLESVAVGEPTCHRDWGREVGQVYSPDACDLVVQGDTLTILNPGHAEEIRWLAEAIDQSGNRIVRQCSVDVVSATPTHLLSVSAVGTGTGAVTSSPPGILCGADCEEVFLEGTDILLSGTPSIGSKLTSWTGHTDCSDGLLAMNGPRSCTATFNTCSSQSEFTLENTSVSTHQVVSACNYVYVGPDVQVTGSGVLDIYAGNEVAFYDGFETQLGGEMTVVIGQPMP